LGAEEKKGRRRGSPALLKKALFWKSPFTREEKGGGQGQVHSPGGWNRKEKRKKGGGGQRFGVPRPRDNIGGLKKPLRRLAKKKKNTSNSPTARRERNGSDMLGDLNLTGQEKASFFPSH